MVERAACTCLVAALAIGCNALGGIEEPALEKQPLAACSVDGELNGDETAVDCGGSCSPCGDWSFCRFAEDCWSSKCSGAGTEGAYCEPAHCNDGIQNGIEWRPDCGGDCPACADGTDCTDPSQCMSLFCGASATCEPNPCNDLVQSGNETDVDCGGGSCAVCGVGYVCAVDGDCEHGCDLTINRCACSMGAECASGLCLNGYCLCNDSSQCVSQNCADTDGSDGPDTCY